MRQQYDKTKIFCIALAFALGALILSGLTAVFGAEGIGMKKEEAAAGDGSVVAVYVEGKTSGTWSASGSGVILAAEEDSLWIVTAGHVLERAGTEHPVKVEFGEGSIVESQRYELVRDTDLAFLCILKENLPEECRELKASETDKESYDALEDGDIVCLNGYRDGRLSVFAGVLSEPWIYVEDFEQYMMVAACEMDYGMSGGGLYDEEGRLIGIACGGNERGELAAVPLHVVWARFEELKK